MNWQPIETAPKDGTRVLIWDGCTVYLASFGFDVGNGPMWQPEYAEVPMYDDDGPTHWQPLPAPPRTDEPGVTFKITGCYIGTVTGPEGSFASLEAYNEHLRQTYSAGAVTPIVL